jgi:hypothetical protein
VSNDLSLQLTYSGTPTQVNAWFESAVDGSSVTMQQANSSSTNVSKILYSNIGSVSGQTVDFRVKGILRTNTAGTFTPQIKLSTQPTISGFNISNNAFVKVKAIGSSTVTNVGAWA